MCGKTSTKIPMKNHILKNHNSGDEKCYLIKAEGAYNKDYWLFFTVSSDETLTKVDEFLREIWCECCGHLSMFKSKGGEIEKSRKISALKAGDKLLYEYDFGSTTEIILTVVSEASRPRQGEEVLLLARNEPISEVCETCQAIASCINAWGRNLVCETCAEEDYEDAFMPIVNSPRMGECAYYGEKDRWTFNPEGKVPQE